MIIAAYSDDGSNNESKYLIQYGAHIFLSDNYPSPCIKFPVLTVAQIIKLVIFYAAESELGVLFITAK